MAALQKVFERALDSDSQVYLCAIDDEDVVGFVSLTIKTIYGRRRISVTLTN
jgi:hypothetical protein